MLETGQALCRGGGCWGGGGGRRWPNGGGSCLVKGDGEYAEWGGG